MLRDQLLELGDEVVVSAECELRVDPQLVGALPPLAEDGTLRLDGVRREVAERLAAPEPERLGQPLGSDHRRACLERGSPVGDEAIEAVEIELPRADGQHVAGAASLDARAAELLPQPVHVDLQRLGRSRRRVFSPEKVDRPLARDDLVRVQEQEYEEQALLRRPERNRASRDLRLDRPEQSELRAHQCGLRVLFAGDPHGHRSELSTRRR